MDGSYPRRGSTSGAISRLELHRRPDLIHDEFGISLKERKHAPGGWKTINVHSMTRASSTTVPAYLPYFLISNGSVTLPMWNGADPNWRVRSK